MGFTKPIEQLLLSYQGTINVSEIYYTSWGIFMRFLYRMEKMHIVDYLKNTH
jgi:hypothetical protein